MLNAYRNFDYETSEIIKQIIGSGSFIPNTIYDPGLDETILIGNKRVKLFSDIFNNVPEQKERIQLRELDPKKEKERIMKTYLGDLTGKTNLIDKSEKLNYFIDKTPTLLKNNNPEIKELTLYDMTIGRKKEKALLNNLNKEKNILEDMNSKKLKDSWSKESGLKIGLSTLVKDFGPEIRTALPLINVVLGKHYYGNMIEKKGRYLCEINGNYLFLSPKISIEEMRKVI